VGRRRTRSDWRGRCTAPSCSGRSRRRSAGDPLEDQRTVRECAEISERIGGLLATWTGNRIRTVHGDQDPLAPSPPSGSYGSLRAILLPKDFLRLRLTGTLATDVTDASGTGVFDVHRRRWSGNALEALAIERDWPTVLRWRGYRFHFYSDETGELPNIHVRRDDKMLKLWLSDLTIAASYGFARHEVRSIVRKVDEQRNALLEAWHAHFAHDR
jgi:hypothetical protein